MGGTGPGPTVCASPLALWVQTSPAVSSTCSYSSPETRPKCLHGEREQAHIFLHLSMRVAHRAVPRRAHSASYVHQALALYCEEQLSLVIQILSSHNLKFNCKTRTRPQSSHAGFVATCLALVRKIIPSQWWQGVRVYVHVCREPCLRATHMSQLAVVHAFNPSI